MLGIINNNLTTMKDACKYMSGVIIDYQIKWQVP